MYKKRIEKARAQMAQEGIDQLLLTHSTDLFYLTGAHGMAMERLACLFLSGDKAYFVAPGFEIGSLPPASRELMECHGWKDGDDPFALVAKLLGNAKRKVAVGRNVPGWVLLGMQETLSGAAWVSADAMMTALRSVKDEYEYKMMKQVQEKSCKALEKVWEHGVEGRTEIEVSRMLRDFSAEFGVDCAGGGVASGPNSGFPHHHAGDRVIQKGDVVTIDYGGEEPGIGYQADTTRTFAVGFIPEGFQEIYDIVREANQAVFEAAKPGIPCEELDAVARGIITKAGYGEYFTHRVGHGLGLDVHEHPYLSAGNTQALQAGNAVSDEPGIYLPDRYGVRIEDQLFIHEDGAERMTPLHHDLLVVD